MPCTPGGPLPGGVDDPCQTIHQDCLELWLVNEESGATAFGYKGLADLAMTAAFGGTADSWNHPADDDEGRKFFGGFGSTVLPPGLGILSEIGTGGPLSGFTIAQRRWFTGLEHIIDPVAFAMTGFGFNNYDYLLLTGSSGPPVPKVYVRPELSGSGPCFPVTPGPFYREGDTVIPGTTAIGVPADSCPTVEPPPYLVVITVVAIAADRIVISVYGHDGTTFYGGVCFETEADGSVGHIDGGDGGGPDGDPTNYGDLRNLGVGGLISDDTIHQAAIWNRALTSNEVAWLGDNLDKLKASIDSPGSQCGGAGACLEPAGSGTINPLIDAEGNTAIHPEFPLPRRDLAGVIASTGSELRETRLVHEARPRVYELPWSLCPGPELDLIRQALEVTRGGSQYTRWRHPIDDPPGDICSAPRWRIVNAAEVNGLVVRRGRGGHVGSLRLVLEEVPLT